jgi:hypothetical protein
VSLAVDLTAVRPGVVDRLLGRSDREPTYGDATAMYEALGLEPPPFVHFDFKAARTLAALVDAALTRDRPAEVVPARGEYENIRPKRRHCVADQLSVIIWKRRSYAGFEASVHPIVLDGVRATSRALVFSGSMWACRKWTEANGCIVIAEEPEPSNTERLTEAEYRWGARMLAMVGGRP